MHNIEQLKIADKIKIILISLGREVDDLNNQFLLPFSALDIDSLDFVEIIMNIEKKFNITITNEEASKCENFNDLVILIESKLQ